MREKQVFFVHHQITLIISDVCLRIVMRSTLHVVIRNKFLIKRIFSKRDYDEKLIILNENEMAGIIVM